MQFSSHSNFLIENVSFLDIYIYTELISFEEQLQEIIKFKDEIVQTFLNVSIMYYYINLWYLQ